MNRSMANGETEAGHKAVSGCSPNNRGWSGHAFRDHQYGRRVEADHSWTVYHVFTGIPAHVDGAPMVGLTRAHATTSMLDLNRRNAEARKEWNRTRPAAAEYAQTRVGNP
ncbi:hypothetical protein [Mesorhizobium sp. B2-6-2]|uniref:hypothetical protein n=1 Tax=Mesorhizobium sp. B2-6-2 TaxID=2589915 RepID=UPI0015E2763F|nr:hypothetical protein [Mesorhizobium sp. B2-6-2]